MLHNNWSPAVACQFDSGVSVAERRITLLDQQFQKAMIVLLNRHNLATVVAHELAVTHKRLGNAIDRSATSHLDQETSALVVRLIELGRELGVEQIIVVRAIAADIAVRHSCFCASNVDVLAGTEGV